MYSVKMINAYCIGKDVKESNPTLRCYSTEWQAQADSQDSQTVSQKWSVFLNQFITWYVGDFSFILLGKHTYQPP